MLALLAILGALGAGLIADVVTQTPKDSQDTPEDDPDEGESTGEADPSGSTMLDWTSFDADTDPDGPQDDDPQDDDPSYFADSATVLPPINTNSGQVVDGMPVSDDIADAEETSVMLSGGGE